MKSSNDFDQVWDKLIDLFAQNGLSIKLIDRSSGLVISDNSAVLATWEDKDDNLVHNNADIVIPKYKNSSLQAYVPVVGGYYKRSDMKNPVRLRGEWNVRVKRDGQGSSINVNLINVTFISIDSKGIAHTQMISDYVSTGHFEKEISNIIK
ncbi:MAG: hypothetical protein ACTHMC_29330 [Pseudobacter sp.]|uniref:hypothetical protein n=1 Tax=Pseudobacter sp. TaxID=2045420 RepID=UPI003F7F62B2